MAKSEKASRCLLLMTYACDKQIRQTMKAHQTSIRGYCFIFHDKDEAEPHHHVVVRTFSAWKPSQLQKWFADLLDDDGKPVNTFAENVSDVSAVLDYLTHSDPKSIEAGKHRYSPDDIFDYGFFQTVEKNDSKDNSYEIVNNILGGASCRDLVRLYGREYLYHYRAYHVISLEIFRQEKNQHPNYKEVTFLDEKDDLPF